LSTKLPRCCCTKLAGCGARGTRPGAGTRTTGPFGAAEDDAPDGRAGPKTGLRLRLIRDGNAADRADFAAHRVLRAALMHLLSGRAPTEWSTRHECASARAAALAEYGSHHIETKRPQGESDRARNAADHAGATYHSRRVRDTANESRGARPTGLRRKSQLSQPAPTASFARAKACSSAGRAGAPPRWQRERRTRSPRSRCVARTSHISTRNSDRSTFGQSAWIRMRSPRGKHQNQPDRLQLPSRTTCRGTTPTDGRA